jgi:hypothetical protein
VAGAELGLRVQDEASALAADFLFCDEEILFLYITIKVDRIEWPTLCGFCKGWARGFIYAAGFAASRWSQ